MADPNVLRISYNPLYLQVRDYLLQDVDPQYGLLSALGVRDGTAAHSVYPAADYSNDGPEGDRTTCPTPFIIVYDSGKRRMDDHGRELEVVVEIHDDEDHGVQRWPGLLERLYLWLLGGKDAGGTMLRPFIPASDTMHRYSGSLYFKSESPSLPDTRYKTRLVQAMFCARATDRTSGRGIQG